MRDLYVALESRETPEWLCPNCGESLAADEDGYFEGRIWVGCRHCIGADIPELGDGPCAACGSTLEDTRYFWRPPPGNTPAGCSGCLSSCRLSEAFRCLLRF